jgi:hypothetical protein
VLCCRSTTYPFVSFALIHDTQFTIIYQAWGDAVSSRFIFELAEQPGMSNGALDVDFKGSDR